MLSAKETGLVLEKFFNDCLNFWKRTMPNEREAFVNALDDVKKIKHNPFTPCGELLDVEAKEHFVRYREMDLGIRG